MKILVTGANGDIGEAVGRILKEEFPDAVISGADAAGRWPGGVVYQNMIDVPLASAPEYLDSMQNLAKQFDLIIPTSEPELVRLALVKNIKSRLPLLMVDPVILNTFMDKYEAFNFFKKNKIKSPETKLFAEISLADLPAYIKPRRGAGSRGHRLVRSDLELQAAKQFASDEWIAQEYLPGDDNEYTCALCCLGDDIKYLVLKRQLQGDKTVKAEVVDSPEIFTLLEKIAQVIELDGCINVQLKMTDQGPVVFEINPRFSSTVMMRHRLGFKDCQWWVRDFFRMPVSDYCVPQSGTLVYRMSTEYVVPRGASLQFLAH
jgi:carbamoyl-phosphate synthase large subunit